MKPIPLISVAVLVFPLEAVQAQETPLWRYTTTEKISFYQVTPLGDLMVGTKEEVVALDPETGDVRWSRNDILKKPGGLVINPGLFPGAAFDPIPFSPYGVVRTNDGIVMIDLGTGETLWDSTAVPLDKVRGHLTVPRHNMLLVYGETPESKRTLVAVDIATGEVGWRQDTLFRRSSPNLQRINSLRSLSGQQPPLVDTDSTFILNLSKDGPMRIHSHTGELLWRLDLKKDPPLLREGYAPMSYDSGVLFVPYEKKLVAVNTNDGSVIWDRRRNFRSRVAQMKLTPHGLVVRGRKPDEEDPAKPGSDFFIDLVDLATGTSTWEREFKDLKINTPFIVHGDGIFVTRREEFVVLDYADGSSLKLAEFEFEGPGENPKNVEIVGANFLLSANQNFFSVNRSGAVQYHSYFESPGRSLLENVAILASATAMARAEGDSVVYVRAAMEEGDESWSRFQNAEHSVNFAYVYTKQPDSSGHEGFSLVKLDKRSGEEVGRVWIDERRPDYVLDWMSGFVFVKENDKEIIGLKFPS